MMLAAVPSIGIGIFALAFGIAEAVGILPDKPTILAAPSNPAYADEILVGVVGTAFLAWGGWLWHGARALRRLEAGGKPAAYAYGVASLLGFPLGTLIGVAVLALVSGRRSTYALSPEYRAIVAATPEIRAKLSIVTKVAICALVLAVGLVLMAVAMSLLQD